MVQLTQTIFILHWASSYLVHHRPNSLVETSHPFKPFKILSFFPGKSGSRFPPRKTTVSPVANATLSSIGTKPHNSKPERTNEEQIGLFLCRRSLQIFSFVIMETHLFKGLGSLRFLKKCFWKKSHTVWSPKLHFFYIQ